MTGERCSSGHTWQVPAAAPRDPRPVVAGPGAAAVPYRAWHDRPRPIGHHHGRARAIETTATEVPRTWSAPATRSAPGDRLPVARRVGAPTAGPHPHPTREHGERALFLALARQRLAGGIPLGLVPRPPLRATPDRPPAPRPTYPGVDPDDLLTSFARAVEEAGGVCHQVVGQVPDLLLDQLVAELDAWDVVTSDDPEARALGERLADRGVEVAPAGRDAAARAVLGVTSATAGIAASGAVVLDSGRSGGQLCATLPPTHLCVLPVERLVATPGDVLRPLGTGPDDPPSSLSLVTGPSRVGDVEQLLTAGAPGPSGLHIVVICPPSPVPAPRERRATNGASRTARPALP